MISLDRISETPTTHSKGAGNRPGWFVYPGHQYVHLSDGSSQQVPRGTTPLDYCAQHGIDTAQFLADIAEAEQRFQELHPRHRTL